MFGRLPLALISNNDVKNLRWFWAGSIPFDLCDRRKPTASDIMGQRVQSDGYTYSTKVYLTRQEALDDAKAKGHKVTEPVKA